jgi:FkbM family methyltransferase
MRKELFYNPRLLLERIAEASMLRRRFARLKGTVAEGLLLSQISSLEFLETMRESFDIKTIYDIGANEGTWSRLAKAVLPESDIHSFEPLKRYQAEFKKNTAGMKKITLHPVGAGSVTKEAPMNVVGHSSSFLEVTQTLIDQYDQKYEGNETVMMVSLDEYVRSNQLPLPDLIKLDVEGYEMEALKGGLKCMDHCRALILEVSFIERHVGQPLFPEITNFLYQHNFHIKAFAVDMPRGKEVVSTDIFYARR